ncbi:MAG TPA: ECF transporter S component [Candidatus Prevotella avicola]|uniref:ECF transporter S component n=1 Tax=Candidatus Prevotella avicola TaxID=2838738 RepID=A0A9D2FXX0_9BACT|nr:ECF transporter S component [Candidatus Prevotella avicola]
MEIANRLCTLGYRETKTYLVASLFVIGNIVLPQLFHLVPQGGVMWLPIYFFTLVGAYKYGWQVGLLTALLSPVVNSLLFAMPYASALPAILLKSTLLALLAGYAARRYQRVSPLLVLGVVLGYQVLGTLGEWAMKGDFYLAAQDFRLGLPGMALQVVGGYLVIKHLIRK